MKNVVVEFFDHLEKEVLKSLCKGVNDTVATGAWFPEKELENKSLGAADLWSIRKNMKTANGRWNNTQNVLFIRD